MQSGRRFSPPENTTAGSSGEPPDDSLTYQTASSDFSSKLDLKPLPLAILIHFGAGQPHCFRVPGLSSAAGAGCRDLSG
jgi:hypothetical protein